MIALLDVCFLAALTGTPDATIPVVPVIAVGAPDGTPRGGRPSGGTPEPATMLLLAGGAVAYAASMRKQRKSSSPKDSDG